MIPMLLMSCAKSAKNTIIVNDYCLHAKILAPSKEEREFLIMNKDISKKLKRLMSSILEHDKKYLEYCNK
jgi:hypothetical protein